MGCFGYWHLGKGERVESNGYVLTMVQWMASIHTRMGIQKKHNNALQAPQLFMQKIESEQDWES